MPLLDFLNISESSVLSQKINIYSLQS